MAVDGKAIRHKMIDLGINSITELSEKSGVNRNTVAEVLDGKIRPSTSTMDKLYRALEMTPEEGGRIFFGQKLTQ